MKITIGMPEILVLFSLLIYHNNFWFSIVAFCLGVGSRLASTSIEQAERKQRILAISNLVTTTVASIISSQNKQHDGDGRFH